MGVFTRAAGGVIGTVAQAGALASIGATVVLAAGVAAACKVVKKAEGRAAGATTFEGVPSLREAVSLGIVAADRGFKAGFAAFDRAVSRRWVPESQSGRLSFTDPWSVEVPGLDAIIIDLHGPEHDRAIRAAVDIAEHGSPEQVAHLLLVFMAQRNQDGLAPFYAAAQTRL